MNNFTKELEHFVIKIEAGDAHHSNCKRKHSHPNPNSHADNSNHTHNTVMEWFKMENDKKTPNILLSSPIDSPLKLENFPSGGSKSVILSLVPVKIGLFNLKDELKVQNCSNGKYLKFNSITIKVE